MSTQEKSIIEIDHLKTRIAGKVIHDDISLKITRGEVFAIVGGSGSGKSTLLRCILTLLRPVKGSIKVFGKDIIHCSASEVDKIRRRWGVMFQSAALFSSLTTLGNVAFPLRQYTELSAEIIEDFALLKLGMAGLTADAANKYPSELSGGMQKRAALARAIALDPELLFLDEPNAGLDPEGASALDELILDLRKMLGLTVVIVTHDLDTLWRIADRVVFIGEKKILAMGTMQEVVHTKHPLIDAFFNGPRGRVISRQQHRDS